MKLKRSRILITGADGFIGSHLTQLLVEAGCQVRALVQYNSLNSWGCLDDLPQNIKDNVEVISGDIRDAAMMRDVVGGCDIVFHLAALIAIPYSYQAPQSYIETNVQGTLNLLQAAQSSGVQKFIHTSTSEVYGTAQSVPIHESHALNAQSPYAASKIGADQMAMSFFYSFNLPVAIIRPFNTYGPRQSARAIIPTIMTQMAAGQRVIELGDLKPTRDFTFVEDTVNGFKAIAESDETVGQVMHVGSGGEISIGDLAHLIAEVMDVKVDIAQDEKRLRPQQSEVMRLWADIQKVQQLTQWSPQYSGREGLARGLTQTLEWLMQKENLQQYRVGQYTV